MRACPFLDLTTSLNASHSPCARLPVGQKATVRLTPLIPQASAAKVAPLSSDLSTGSMNVSYPSRTSRPETMNFSKVFTDLGLEFSPVSSLKFS